MLQNLNARIAVIVAVLALCVWSIYPPERRLLPGLDLAGGFELTYQVQVPPGEDAKTVVDQVIATLRKRIDPRGVMNLIWRPLAGNRIEIQAAAPPKQVKGLRQAYMDVRKAFFEGNLSRRQLENALRLDHTVRADTFKAMAGSSAHQTLFDALIEAYVARQTAESLSEPANVALQSVEQELAALPADASDEQRAALQKRKQELVVAGEPLTRKFNSTKVTYDRSLRAALAGNISASALDQVLAMPDTLTPKEVRVRGADAKTLRRQGLDRLIEAHRGRREALEALATKYAAYEEFKGRLADPEDLIALLKGQGVLEFRIGFNSNEVPDVQAYRDQLAEKGPRAGREKDHRWFVIDDIKEYAGSRSDLEELHDDPEAFFAQRGRSGLIGQAYGGDYYVLLGNLPETSMTDRSEWKMSQASHGIDERAMSAVDFRLDNLGGHLMRALTGNHVNKPMAIVLDERVISTPNLQTQIGDRGQITGGSGGFDRDEADYLVRTLNAGSLEGRISPEPIMRNLIGPQFGADNLKSGELASLWALVLVALFMAAYYFFWGAVANFALFANMVIILGVMAFLRATFTLPGIAAIVLTIGMAVDANVLIFERIREELRDAADMTTAIRLGFEKALSTIVDANLTTLITCVVLYYTATAEIKGFALTLGIGIAATLFTALFCSRTLVELYVKYTGGKGTAMLPMAVPAVSRFLSPQVDWVAKRKLFMTISIVLIVAGSLMVWQRGAELLDIEFRTGTKVGITFKEDAPSMTMRQVRERLTEGFQIAATELDAPVLDDLKPSVVTAGKVVDGKASSFHISVVHEDSRQVALAIRRAFPNELQVVEPIKFVGSDAQSVRMAPAYRITDAELGANISQPSMTVDVQEFLGGVAFVLDQLEPSATEQELARRIERMRNQDEFSQLGHRPTEVFGLEPDESANAGGTQVRYRSAVVIVRDELTNYIETPDAFTEDATGLAATEWELLCQALLRESSLDSVSSFSSQISLSMKLQAVQAMVLSLLAVVAYIWIRFGSLRYGLAAIVALVHDVLITLGLVALCHLIYDNVVGQALGLTDFKIGIAMVAAFLTIVGYSLNDTIVIFDRIRENRGRLTKINADLVNRAINQTVSRTVITSGTTLVAVGTLYIFGGPGVHGFAFALIIGVIVGTYSSVAIAAPILLFSRKKTA